MEKWVIILKKDTRQRNVGQTSARKTETENERVYVKKKEKIGLYQFS